MTAPDEERILARVRRLLAKAEGASTEHERDAYTQKAADLIATYGIDEALVAAKDPEHHQPADAAVEVSDPYATDKCQLLGAICRPLRIYPIRRKIPNPNGTRPRWLYQMHLFGMPADLERAEVLYTSLLVQMAQWSAVARPEPTLADAIRHTFYGRSGPVQSSVRGDQLAAYRRSWMAGFAYRIQQRLEEAEAAAKARRQRDEQAYARQRWFDGEESVGEPGVALVLADQFERVEQLALDTYKDQLRPSRMRKLSGDGADDGIAAANRADLGGSRLGQTQRRQIS